MKKRYKIPLVLLCVLGVAAGGAYALVPWKDIAGQRLRLILESKGFENVRLSVQSAGMTEATLRDVTIGGEDPLTLRDLTIKYDWRELKAGNLRDLTLTDLALTIRQTDGKWGLQGFRPAPGGAPFSIPDTVAEVRTTLPFENVELKNSRLAVITPAWRADLLLNAEWHRSDDYRLSASLENPTFQQGAIKAAAATTDITVNFNNNAQAWSGTWKAANIDVQTEAVVPRLNGGGDITAHADHVKIDGYLEGTDGKTIISFTTEQHFTAPEKNRLTIKDGKMPWKNGTLRVRNVAIPMGKKAPIRFDLIVDKVSLDELMQAMTGKRVSATGVVSGTIPLVYNTDGSIAPGTGGLNAAEPGTITMPPDAIPGDNEQIALTRNILANFHYQDLAISTEPAPDGGVVVLLALQGNNPDVYDGRAVKLNVRLTGDVLDFVRQNVILLTTPEKLLQQGTP